MLEKGIAMASHVYQAQSQKTVKMIVSYYIIYTNDIDRTDIEATMCKISNFSIVIIICPKYYCTKLCFAKSSCAEI